MKSALLLASLLVALSSTAALSQTESVRSTTRRTTTAAPKKQSSSKKTGTTKKSSKGSKTTGSSSTTSSAPVASSTGTITSTVRRDVPARQQQPAQQVVSGSAPVVLESRPIESWYVYYGVGYAKPSYPAGMQSLADEMSAAPGVTNASIAMDAAGIYAPYNGSTHLLVGGVVNLALDTYIEGESSITMTQATVASSALYFPGRIGEGVYLRGDIGLAAMSISNELDERLESPVGVGMLAGAGYALPLSNGTDLMINASYSVRAIDGEMFGTMGATVGVMF